MTAVEIIQQLEGLKKSVRSTLDHESLRTRTLHTTRSYDFIYFEWSNDDTLFARLEFTCTAGNAELKLVYCEDKPLEDALRKSIPTSLPLIKGTFSFSETIQDHLITADRIAGLTMNCASGDSYRPGNFSRVLLAEDHILLSQINHMNAKSLAHKENYSLRDLEFFIPLTATPNIKFHHDYHSGDMLVRFDDRSSKNNRQYGDRVTEELTKLR